MRFPRWFRHFVAHYSVAMADERIGKLYDYANGKMELLHTWKNFEDKKTAISLTEAMLNAGRLGELQGSLSIYTPGGRDAIYVCSVSLTDACGTFQVIDSNRKFWERFWAIGIYNPEEAYVDTLTYLKKRALEMGWAAPKEESLS